jgi:hypothetical protein
MAASAAPIDILLSIEPPQSVSQHRTCNSALSPPENCAGPGEPALNEADQDVFIFIGGNGGSVSIEKPRRTGAFHTERAGVPAQFITIGSPSRRH